MGINGPARFPRPPPPPPIHVPAQRALFALTAFAEKALHEREQNYDKCSGCGAQKQRNNKCIYCGTL